MTDENENKISVLVDVGVLKSQVGTLIEICKKLDTIIEKMAEVQEKHTEQIYSNIEKRRVETQNDIDSTNSKIEEFATKLQASEAKIMEK